jgi:hypothetical protein
MTISRIPSVEGGIQPTLLTAKGDLISATAASTVARLAVGSDSQILVADSSTATGLKWATPATASSGLTFITSSTFSNVASVTVDSCFSSTYDQYVLTFTDVYAATGGDDAYFQFRYGSTTFTGSYYGSWWYFPTSGSSLVTGQFRAVPQFTLGTNTGASSEMSSGTMQIGAAGKSSTYPMISGTYGNLTLETMANFGGGAGSTQAMTGFVFKSASTNVTGTIRVYGLAKS